MNNPYIMFLLAMVIFGSNGIIASYIPLSSYEIVLCRVGIGGICLLIFALFRHELGELARHKKQTFWLVLAGVCLALNWMFLFEAYKQIGVSLAIIMCYCGPVLVMILSRFIFHEPFTLPKVIGIILVTIGMICINGADFQSHGLSWGMITGFLAALFFAFLVISMKKTEGLPGVVGAAGQLLVATVIVGAVTLTAHSGPVMLTAEALIYVAVIGLVNTGLAYFLYLSAIQRLPAQTVSVLGYVEPLSALFLSAVLLGEVLTSMQWLGVALVLGGVALSELWKRGYAKRE